MLAIAITMMTLGQILFSFPQLLAKYSESKAYLPLALFLLANGVIALGPIIFSALPEFYDLYIALIFPAFLALAPLLWLYVEAITSMRAWCWHRKHLIDIMPIVLGVITACLLISLSAEQMAMIFAKDSDIEQGYLLVVVLFMFSSMLVWLLQSAYYLQRIIRRLLNYRIKLKQHFANHEQRDLAWLSWVLFIVVMIWCLAFSGLMLTLLRDIDLFSYWFGALLLLILVWTMAYWGLRQKPGFTEQYLTQTLPTGDSELITTVEHKKYQRSALAQEQAQRIAEKLTASMVQEKLYLDANISLHKLAKHLTISANYISQTLNQSLGYSFFDFINHWRVEEAKTLLVTSSASVLDISLQVGFNARSSFYKVFKKQTGMTPSEYRKSHTHSAI